jgi:hypothetical protein
MLAAFERAIHANQSALARRDFVSGMLAQLGEDWFEQRVLELLRNGEAGDPTQAERERAPFEIAVVKGEKNHALAGTRFGQRLIQATQIEPFSKILVCHTSRPEEVEHRSHEILIRLPHHFGTAMR